MDAGKMWTEVFVAELGCRVCEQQSVSHDNTEHSAQYRVDNPHAGVAEATPKLSHEESRDATSRQLAHSNRGHQVIHRED
jgi:hypothetical protein